MIKQVRDEQNDGDQPEAFVSLAGERTNRACRGDRQLPLAEGHGGSEVELLRSGHFLACCRATAKTAIRVAGANPLNC